MIIWVEQAFFYEQQGMICDCNTMRARIKKFLKFWWSSSKRLEQVNLRVNTKEHQSQLINTGTKTRALYSNYPVVF